MVMRNAAVNNSPWQKELNLFLGAYRATPHSSTGVAPASLLFKFNNTSRLSSPVKSRKFNSSNDDAIAIHNDSKSRTIMKKNGDRN